MKIAIVILNWNGEKLLKQFLPSVIQHSDGADIYVADNASSDNSVAIVNNLFPHVKIIQNLKNEGYAKGYNNALKHIDADVFCLLNSDVEVTSNWLTPIILEYKNNISADIIQPKILDFKNKSLFEYAGAGGGFIDKYGYAYCRGRIFESIEKDMSQYNDTAPVLWASGACFFIKKSTFKALNGFDDTYFAHFEEIDLCWRAFNAGFTTTYVGTSTVYHVGGATLHAGHPKKTYLNFRNSLFTITKNAKGFLLGIIFVRLVLDGIAALKFLFDLKFAHFMAIIKAHLVYYAHLPRLLKIRQQLPTRKNYYQTKSIVWFYYIKNQKKF